MLLCFSAWGALFFFLAGLIFAIQEVTFFLSKNTPGHITYKIAVQHRQMGSEFLPP